MHSFFLLLTRAVAPRSLDEDRARREFIVNILLLGTIFLLGAACVIDTLHLLLSEPLHHAQDSLGSLVLFGILGFFIFLYQLSRRGNAWFAAYLLVLSFGSLAAYMGLRWGVDVTASLLLYALTIVMAGILIDTRFAFLTTLVVGCVLGATGYLQYMNIAAVDRNWRAFSWEWSDLVMITIIFFLIATISWLGNREIEKSLARARRSEKELMQERDLLELRVEERTHELRQVELEKMSQTYHLVEFGRIAGGVFHDLINPLMALSLHIDNIAGASAEKASLAGDIRRAKRAAAHMQELLQSLRSHLRHDDTVEEFSLREAIEDVVAILTSYARAQQVQILQRTKDDVIVCGNRTSMLQVLTNLLGNAVQAYPLHTNNDAFREVFVTLTREGNQAQIDVQDFGTGISREALAQIFEPFFTTKEKGQGIGLGLSVAKRIIEKEFGGTITATSELGNGTTFTLYLPLREP